MRLENLYENFGKASPETQQAMIASYRLRRAEDMSKPVPSKTKKKVSDKKSQYDLSDEEKAVMKALGLKPKDIIALRSTTVQEADSADEIDNGVELFTDPTFDEGGEDE